MAKIEIISYRRKRKKEGLLKEENSKINKRLSFNQQLDGEFKNLKLFISKLNGKEYNKIKEALEIFDKVTSEYLAHSDINDLKSYKVELLKQLYLVVSILEK